MKPTKDTLNRILMVSLIISTLMLAVLTFANRAPRAVSAAALQTATATTGAATGDATVAATDTTESPAQATITPVTVAPALDETPAVETAAQVPARLVEPGSITVSGSAQVLVAPDEVILTLGVETSDMEMSAAKRKNDEIIQKVLEIATKYEVDPKHVQTDFINIEPRYSSTTIAANFIGYFVRKTVEIRLNDISKFESLYSDMLEAGVNYVHGVEFRTTELRKYRDQARALAIQAAQEKAAALASGVNQATGRVKMIHEDSSGWYGSYNSWWRGSSYGFQNVIQNAGGGQFVEEGTLAPGQISVSASVTVEFELVPNAAP